MRLSARRPARPAAVRCCRGSIFGGPVEERFCKERSGIQPSRRFPCCSRILGTTSARPSRSGAPVYRSMHLLVGRLIAMKKPAGDSISSRNKSRGWSRTAKNCQPPKRRCTQRCVATFGRWSRTAQQASRFSIGSDPPMCIGHGSAVRGRNFGTSIRRPCRASCHPSCPTCPKSAKTWRITWERSRRLMQRSAY
jgi:hypothetical protein